MDELEAFERSYMRDMKTHCDAGMRLPKDTSATAVLENNLRLVLTTNEFLGSKEFMKQRNEFARHVEDFATRYELDIKKVKDRIPSTVFRRIVRK